MRTALIFIDVQESFRHRPFWNASELPRFIAQSQALLEGCIAQGIPQVRILHQTAPGSGPFASDSPLVRTLTEFADWQPSAEFRKSRHSALVGTGLGVWLHQQNIGRLIIAGIRTEQCCETTARHASDEGFEVDFVTDATLTFAMQHPTRHTELSPADIYQHTETVLAGRFAQICTVSEALQRSREAADD